jgi:predicted RND superfamily exporter protein
MDQFLNRLVAALIRYRWPLFVLALLLAALAWFPSRFVRFDRSIENMFAPDDPLIPSYLRLKRDFGGNEVILAVYQDDHLLDPDGRGLARLAEITERIETVPGIDGVLSLSKINDHLKQLEKTKNLGGVLDLFREGSKPAPEPILDQKNPLASRFRDLFSGYTHSPDGHTAAVLCMVKPHSTPGHPLRGSAPREGIISRSEMTTMVVPREKTIADLQTIIHNLPNNLSPGFLAGEPVMLGQGFSILEADARRLGIYTTILLGLTILIFFRSLRWLVIPIAVVQWSLLTTRAVLVVSGLQLSMVSSMLTAIVTVVGVATVMHLIVHVRELRTQGLTQRAALQTASLYLAGPIVGAILTDMAGFGALCWSSVQPVRDFGTMMVIGSLLVIPATCLLTPALALLAARDQPTPKPHRPLAHALHRCHPRPPQNGRRTRRPHRARFLSRRPPPRR